MRTVISINKDWLFDKGMQGNYEAVDLPHCYNALDDQDVCRLHIPFMKEEILRAEIFG